MRSAVRRSTITSIWIRGCVASPAACRLRHFHLSTTTPISDDHRRPILGACGAIIPISDGPLPESDIRLWMGRARGYFEGNTLIVETTNFTDRSAIRGHAHTDQLTVTERFTLTGADSLDYDATVTDPETWVTPWKAGIGLSRNDTYSMYDYACHEGNNYAMTNMLSGARADERAGR